jgi:maltose/moltooligosaccharide transporter
MEMFEQIALEPSASRLVMEPIVPRFHAGTLNYTLRGLILLFVWLLWGDFCFAIFESIFGRFLPLYMNNLHASNAMIGVMTGSIAGVVNLLFLPNISMASDRHRGRWGRRIPFLFWATPCTVVSLSLIGFAPEIGNWLYTKTILFHLQLSASTIILTTLGIFVVLYHFFNMVLVSIFACLVRDVVPLEIMARSLALFRMVGTAGGFLFNWYLFRYILDYRKAICVGVGLVYLISFMLVCWQVKEGEYPPPPVTGARPGVLKAFLVYFRQCALVPLYRNYMITYMLATIAGACAIPFVTLFAKKTLGLNLEDMGKIFAWGGVATFVLLIPMGYLCDKIAAPRVLFASLIGTVASTAFALFFVHDKHTWLVYSTVISIVPSVAWGLASSATTMLMFPSKQFGQLSSGINVLGWGSMILGNFIAGWYIDRVGGNYRMIFLWSIGWYSAAAVAMYIVCRGWQQHGGASHYAPPPLPE